MASPECVPDSIEYVATAAEPKPVVVAWILLLLYMFWAIKIVINRSYLPASKVLAYKLNLSQDVAWATLLAASNSAPIFFVNWFSTFQESVTTTGIGTLLGSVAFKLLLVLSVCGFVHKSHVDLSWMPMLRDFVFILVGISVLFHFFRKQASSFFVSLEERNRFCITGIESNCCYQHLPNVDNTVAPIEHGVITQYEARVMLFIYPFYLFFFLLQDQIRWWAESTLEKARKGYSHRFLDAKNNPKQPHEQLLRNSHVSMLMSTDPVEQLGIILVTHSRWKMKETFKRLDTDGDGKIDRYELMTMLRSFGQTVDEATALEVIKSIDEFCISGQVEYKAFKDWFVAIETKLILEMRMIFKSLDRNSSSTIRVKDAETVLQYLGNQPDLKTVRSTREMLDINKVGFLTQQDFFYWYRACMLHHKFQKQNLGLSTQNPHDLQEVSKIVKNDSSRPSEHQGGLVIQEFGERRDDSYYDSDPELSQKNSRNENNSRLAIKTPAVKQEDFEGPVIFDLPDAVPQKFGWAITWPVRALLYMFTVLPTGPLKNLTLWKSLWWLVISLILVAAFSGIVLYSAEVIGLTLGIPDTVMGVLFLGVGLSWGWLWSMIKAVRKGHAEIVLSRSLGCVVFDILISLPSSWLISLKHRDGRPLLQNGTNITSSLACLFLIILVTLVLFIISFFRLNRTLSVAMLVYYVIFIAQDLGLASWDNLYINSLHHENSEIVVFCAGCEPDAFCLPLS